MTIRLAPDLPTMRRLAAVARGFEPADTVLTGGALVNVWTEEIQEGWGVALAGDRVAYVGPDPEIAARAGDRTWVVDLGGDLVSPGLLEGHTHLSRVGLAEMISVQLRCGVTTTVLESMELGYVTGPGGVRELLADAEGMPARVFLTVPAVIAADEEQEPRLGEPEEWAALLDHPLVPGAGDVYWADLLRGDRRAESLIEAALARDLVVNGRGAGARLAEVAALSAMGISADHEGISAEDVRLRLRLGLWTMAGHGAMREDLPAISAVWSAEAPSASHLVLVTDRVEPDALARCESLNWVVERAMALGLPAARAIRLASRNPAERFGLGRWLGGLQPAALADVVVVPRDGFRPRLVLVGGSEPGPPVRHHYPDWMRSNLRLPSIDRALLEHPGPGRWRAMRFEPSLVTREAETDGEGALPVLAIDRLGSARAFRGLVLGFGLQGGAVALSSACESASVVAAGDSPPDLAQALAHLESIGGGAVVVAGGQVLAEWRAEIAGLYSEAPLTEVTTRVSAVNAALRGLGCGMPNPLLALETLTTAAIPFIRISAEGYLRLQDGARLGLEVLT